MSEKTEITVLERESSDDSSQIFQEELCGSENTNKQSTQTKGAEQDDLEFSDPFNSASSIAKEFSNRQKGLSELTNWTLQNFSNIDTNSDGTLSQIEIETRMLDKQTADDITVAADLYALETALPHLHSMLNRSAAGSISKHDIEKLKAMADAGSLFENHRTLLKQAIAKDFNEIFRRGKSIDRVTPSEIDEILKRKDLQPEQKEGIQAIKDEMDKKIDAYTFKTKVADGREVFGDGKTNLFREDAAALKLSELTKIAPELAIMNTLGKSREYALAKLDESSKDPDKISQGRALDCFFLAPLISLQTTNHDAIKNMISKGENGKCIVTFPGGKEKIEVDKPTASERAMFAGSEIATTLEKALRNSHLQGMDLDQNVNPLLTVGQIEGGYSGPAFYLLTGKRANSYSLRDAAVGPPIKDADLKELLVSAAKTNRPMAAEYYGDTQDGLLGHHSYSVSFDEKSADLILENPMKPVNDAAISRKYPTEPALANGRPKDGVNDGRFRMSIAEFRQRFHLLTIAGN